jgi:hypothetical protein
MLAARGYCFRMDQKQHLLTLAEALAAHHGVKHFTISMRALGKGDFFQKLFDANWPADLEWPRDIPRPSTSTTAKGRAA